MTPDGKLWDKKSIIESHIINAVFMLYNKPIPEPSILLLAGAAWEMLDALSKRTLQPSTKGMMRSRVEDRFVNKFSAQLNTAYNFVKHSTADPTATLEEDIGWWCGTVLYHACNDYLALFGEHQPGMMVHRMIWRSQNPLLMRPYTTPHQIFATKWMLKRIEHPWNLIMWLENNLDVLERFKREDFPLKQAANKE